MLLFINCVDDVMQTCSTPLIAIDKRSTVCQTSVILRHVKYTVKGIPGIKLGSNWDCYQCQV